MEHLFKKQSAKFVRNSSSFPVLRKLWWNTFWCVFYAPPCRWLYCVQWTQYSIRLEEVHYLCKLFTSCIQRCLVSRACDWVMSALSAVLLIFSFQFSLLFFHVCQPCSTAAYWFTRYQTSDVAENFGRYLSYTERTDQGGDFELILTAKMETRLPPRGIIG